MPYIFTHRLLQYVGKCVPGAFYEESGRGSEKQRFCFFTTRHNHMYAKTNIVEFYKLMGGFLYPAARMDKSPPRIHQKPGVSWRDIQPQRYVGYKSERDLFEIRGINKGKGIFMAKRVYPSGEKKG